MQSKLCMLEINTWNNTKFMHTHWSYTSCHSSNLLNAWIGWMSFEVESGLAARYKAEKRKISKDLITYLVVLTDGISSSFWLPKRIIDVNMRDCIYYSMHLNSHCSWSSYFEEWKFWFYLQRFVWTIMVFLYQSIFIGSVMIKGGGRW